MTCLQGYYTVLEKTLLRQEFDNVGKHTVQKKSPFLKMNSIFLSLPQKIHFFPKHRLNLHEGSNDFTLS